MTKLEWKGKPRVGLWYGRYLKQGETVDVPDDKAAELLARDSRWQVVREKQKRKPSTDTARPLRD